jgi:hypothetical protein
MKLNLKARDWHNWISVILLIPMLIVGLSTLFLAHKKELGLDKLDLTPYVGWLPGYGAAPAPGGHTEARSSLALADGAHLIGTQGGLFRVAKVDDQLRAEAIRELGGTAVRDIAAAPFGIVVAAKNGIWLETRQGWRKALDSDAWNANAMPDGSVVVAVKDGGLLASRDGEAWEALPGIRPALAALSSGELVRERVTLGKLMLDLHTGKAFFGKSLEWIWIYLLGAVWVFLGFTGLWLWWKSQTKRRDAARGKLAAGVARG